MEWKRVKSALILLFLIVDVFLAYQVYTKNVVTNSDTLDALNDILVSRNINMQIDVDEIEIKSKMPKLLITSDTGINEDIMIELTQIEKTAEYIGNKRKIVDLATLMATFIRDTKAENIDISNVYLCYFYNSSQVGENVKYAEAEPSWVIEVENIKYIYSAYTGNYSKKLMKN